MFISPKLSLSDILGADYINSVINACKFFGNLEIKNAIEVGQEKIDFYPHVLQDQNDKMLSKVGLKVSSSFINDELGAPTTSFANAANRSAAPVSGLCNMRIGEDGKLYLVAKSEHYHTPLGHNFNGYKLIDNARKLGITNATHNNTRGYITRFLERELIRCINGLSDNETKELNKILASEEPKVLNRVINLETGSVACEAGIKMMLQRFYRLDKTYKLPKYSQKIPVFFVMADNDGGLEANYHGTSVIAQTFRGMWPELYDKMQQNDIYKVVSVAPNDIKDFAEKIQKFNNGDFKTAGFLHEIILMNYGGIKLSESYLTKTYELCKKYDTPVMVDEIQSCMWYEGMFLFRLYGLTPDFVVLGKGFPGGQYPASKIITTAEMDTLNQFGALVTNGQEELASLSYLITMIFSEANSENIGGLGSHLEYKLNILNAKHPKIIDKIEGKGHCTAIHFYNIESAKTFASKLNEQCIDVSAQVYKANCPPAVLLKPPIIASEKTIESLCDKMDGILETLYDYMTTPANF